MSIKNKIIQYGWKNSFKLFLKSIIRKIGIQLESFWLLENNLSLNEINQKMRKFDYSSVKELNLDDFENGDPSIFNDAKLELIKQRLESDQFWSFGILNENILAYSCWITTLEIGFRKKYNKSIPLVGG